MLSSENVGEAESLPLSIIESCPIHEYLQLQHPLCLTTPTQCLIMASGAQQVRPPRTSDKMPSAKSSNSSTSSNARLTPDLDSDDSDFEMAEQGESYKLQPRAGGSAGVDDGEDEEADEKYSRRRGASMSTVQSYQLYTPDEERAVIRKFDRRLVLFVALLYMLSFLDRSSTCSPPGRAIPADSSRYWKCQNRWHGSRPPSRF
jgi:hypothetical protein